jgi:hypothetical protein
VTDDGIYGGGLRFSGVTFLGPPPLGRVHIPLGEGVQSIYGLNGAGKTRLLRAVQAALTGVDLEPGYAMVHATVTDPGDATTLDWLRGVISTYLGDAREGAADYLADWLANDEGSPERLGWSARFGTPNLPSVLRGDSGRLQRLIEGAPNPADLDPWNALGEDPEDPEQAAQTLDGYLREVVEHHELTQYAYHALSGRLMAHRGTLDALAHDRKLVFIPAGSREAGSWLCYLAGSAAEGPLAPLFQEDLAYWAAHNKALEAAAATGQSRFKTLIEMGQLRGRSTSFPFDEVLGSVRTPAQFTVAQGPQPWPSWITVPAVEIGRTDTLPLHVTDLTANSGVDIDSATTNDMLSRFGRTEETNGAGVLYAVLDEDVEYNETVTTWTRDLADRATQLARHVMPQLPDHLHFDLGHPEDWLRGNTPTWIASPGPTSPSVPLRDLSDAERRWATAGITLALRAQQPGQASVILCDEPESGLHRRAEAALPVALARLAADTASTVLAATHAPSMLDTRHAQPVHLFRNPDGHAEAVAMTLTVRQRVPELLEQLGVSAADLLQWARVLLLVEGEHDRAVFEGLIADALDDAQALVLAMRGAKNLSSLAQADILFDYTDAPILVVLDGVHDDLVTPHWQAAADLAAQGRPGDARRALMRLDELPGGEAKWLRELGQRAVDSGRIKRIHIASIGVPDIICTLPVDLIAPSELGDTWDQVLEGWRRSARPGQTARDLKGWLADKRNGRPVSLREIGRVVDKAATEHLHPALAELAQRISDLAIG